MIDWGYLFGKLFTTVASWLEAGNLRNKLFQIQEEHELMWTALDDIKRMYPDHPATKIIKQTLEKVTQKYGK